MQKSLASESLFWLVKSNLSLATWLLSRKVSLEPCSFGLDFISNAIIPWICFEILISIIVKISKKKEGKIFLFHQKFFVPRAL